MPYPTPITMDNQEYLRLSRDSQTIGDKFYSCINQWLKAPSDGTVRTGCMTTGSEYEEALKRQVEYLRSLPPSKRRDDALENCRSFLESLRSQMALLQKGFGSSGH